jgi:hypothetical protein
MSFLIIGTVMVAMLLALGALIAIWMGLRVVLRSVFRLLVPKVDDMVAMPLRETDSPEIWSAVRDLAKSMNVRPPDHIVTGIDARFFVTDAAYNAAGMVIRGRILNISLPFARQTACVFEGVGKHGGCGQLLRG